MRLSKPELRSRYERTIADYNRTPLARIDGFVCQPTEGQLAQLAECLRRLPSTDATFLDIGTGSGIAPRFFRELGVRAVTVDSRAGGNALDNAIAAGVEGIYCDIATERLPLPDDSVDCILFADVIEHLLHSPKHALSEFRRVLKPGGICVAATPNSTRLSVRLRVLLGYSNWPYIRDYFDLDFHAGHHHEYTMSEFKWVFEQCDFEVIRSTLVGSVSTVEIGSLKGLQARNRSGLQAESRSHPLIRMAKVPIGLVERAVPSVRPMMLLTARKPS